MGSSEIELGRVETASGISGLDSRGDFYLKCNGKLLKNRKQTRDLIGTFLKHTLTQQYPVNIPKYLPKTNENVCSGLFLAVVFMGAPNRKQSTSVKTVWTRWGKRRIHQWTIIQQ